MMGIVAIVALIAYFLGFITYFAVRVGVKELKIMNLKRGEL